MASLPKMPKGKDLEDFVAAYYQAAGYFVEKNLVKQDEEKPMLELDAVVTDYPEGIPASTLVEVKSGDWGFSDLFKQLGHMTYVSIPRGDFVTTTIPKQRKLNFVTFARAEAAPLGIRLIYVDAPGNAGQAFAYNGYPQINNDLALNVWRFSYWIERQMVENVREFIKANETSVAAKDAIRYYKLVNNAVFFVRDVDKRVRHLYSAYQKHPKLTLGACSELDGNGYDPENANPDSTRMREAIFKGKHDLLQACMYFEHRARLSVLKCAVDYLCLKQSGKVLKQPVFFPNSFINGLRKIEAFPHFRKLPHFWQTFLWTWGGFLLTDRRKEEYEQLAAQTGIPEDHIDNALVLYEELFVGHWLENIKNTHFLLLKMVPMPFRGIGAWHRLQRNTFKNYSEFGYDDFTSSDMAEWHTAAARLLETK